MTHPMLTLLGAALLCVGLGAEDKPKPKVVEKAKQEVKPGEKVGINPQPEPPGDKKKVVKPGEVKAKKPNPGEKVGLNPQPEPPKPAKGKEAKDAKVVK